MYSHVRLLQHDFTFGDIFLSVGRISGLEDEVWQVRQALSKAETEKRQLQEKLTDLEKVNIHTDSYQYLSFLYFYYLFNRLSYSFL